MYKSALTILLMVFLGMIPKLVWYSISDSAQMELLQGYANHYLVEHDYCAQARINAYITDIGIEFHGECIKVKC